MKKFILKAAALTLATLFVLMSASCGKKQEGNETELNYDTQNPVVEITIKNYGKVAIELYPEIAPNTVNNFISLVKKGFYDGNSFHRSVPGFMIQGGDPDGQGTGGPGYSIEGEFAVNGFDNKLLHTEGVISMARAQAYNSAGSQFFIMLGTSPHLDGQYAAFGKVIDGMDNVKKIAANERVANPYSGKLENNVVIEKAVVDLKGKTYPEPKKLEK